MDMKYLIIVGFFLAIFTIAAASAADDTAEGNTTEDLIASDDVIGENSGVNVNVNDTVDLEDEFDCAVYVGDDSGLNGTVSVYIEDNSTAIYNKNFRPENGMKCLSIYANDLKISDFGIYKVKAIYQKNGVAEPYVVEKTVDFKYKFEFYPFSEEDDEGLIDEFLIDDRISFKIALPQSASGRVIVNINGKSYEVSLTKAKAIFTPEVEFDVGKYNVTATYLGDEKYPGRTESCVFAVIPEIFFEDMSVGEKSAIILQGSQGTSGSATLYNRIGNYSDQWGSAIITVEVVDGQAIIPVENLTEGIHFYYVNYTMGKYSGYYEVFINASVNSPEFSVNVDKNQLDFGKALNIDIKCHPSFDVMEIYVDGKFDKSVSLKRGDTSASIKGLAVGEHVIKVLLDSNDKFYSNTFFVTVKNPNKDIIKLTLKKVKVKKSAKKLVLKATLKINGKAVKGKTIKFKFNKKTYKAKTNRNGVAKVTVKKSVLKKLKVGKKVKIQATYGKTTKKLTVKVKR
ncbi:MAG: hypothetical protein UH242_03685 [Methanobrevibacter sp.]|nr:hypothetical protein [Methanobrevibacter sp.]